MIWRNYAIQQNRASGPREKEPRGQLGDYVECGYGALSQIAKIDMGKSLSEFSCGIASSPQVREPPRSFVVSESRLATEIEESSVEYIFKIMKSG